MTKSKPLTENEIWGKEVVEPARKELRRRASSLFGFDICDKCKFEIDRSKGLKQQCPKCRSSIRNPV